MNPAIFREYDIRGIAERDFDAGFARALGRTFGTLALEAGKKVVCVGRDCRLTSDAYGAAASRNRRPIRPAAGNTQPRVGVERVERNLAPAA